MVKLRPVSAPEAAENKLPRVRFQPAGNSNVPRYPASYARLPRLQPKNSRTVMCESCGGEIERVKPIFVSVRLRWLSEPTQPEPHLQTVLFAKVVLALRLGRPADGYLDLQRAAHLKRMRELTELKQDGSFADPLLAGHGLYHLEADLRWMDHTAARLDLARRGGAAVSAGGRRARGRGHARDGRRAVRRPG
jgi:hypothetical protein